MGMMTIHIVNVIISVYAKKDQNISQCEWYLIEYMLDTLIGTTFNFLLMKLLDFIWTKCGCTRLISGNYFDKKTSQVSCLFWILQCLVKFNQLNATFSPIF